MQVSSLSDKIEHWEKTKGGRVLLFLLELASYVYYALIWTRIRLYRLGLLPAEEVGCRVVCVGNLTCGGTGKTPTVIHLAQTLSQKGLKVAVVSRGYKGTQRGQLTVVSDGREILQTADAAGDEPYLIARRLPHIPVVIGKRRWPAAMYTYWRFEPQIIILDDGYQHLKLKRDVDFLLLDARQPFGTGHLLPRGSLREPPEAVGRAQIIMLTRAEPELDLPPLIHRVRQYNPKAILLTGVHRPQDLQDLRNKSNYALDRLRGQRVLCFCGVAQPASFQKTVEELGADIVKFIALPDHYPYRQAELSKMQELADSLKAQALVTTEKDAVRIAALPEGGMPWLSLRIHLQITADENAWPEALNIIGGSGVLPTGDNNGR